MSDRLYFTRYFVRDAEGETAEIYDGQDNCRSALAAVESYPGGYVEALEYVSDGQFRLVKSEHDA